MLDDTNFLAEIPSEGEAISFATNEESPDEDQTEESPASESGTETPSPDGVEPDGQSVPNNQDDSNLPFHKHPRWKEMYESKKRLEQELHSLRDEMSQKLSKMENSGTEELPDRFVKLYGDNPEAWKLYREEQQSLKQEILSELATLQEREQVAEREALKEGQSYVDSSLQSLKDDGNVFDENELMKFMVDLKEKFGVIPKDDEDNIDFYAGLSMMAEFKRGQEGEKKARVQAKKSIANFTTSPAKSDDNSQRDFVTSTDMRNMDWDTAAGR